jgi:hypothetical protein
MPVKVIHLVLGLQLVNDSGMGGHSLLESPVLLTLFFLREHEGAKLLKLCLKVSSILLFLKIAEVCMFHRRYYVSTNKIVFKLQPAHITNFESQSIPKNCCNIDQS